MKTPEISLTVNGYDCTGMSTGFSSRDLRLIGKTFLIAADMADRKMHGSVECVKNLASIGIDFGGKFSQKSGLPVIAKIRNPKL